MSDRALRIALVAPLISPIAEPFLGGSQALIFDLAAALAARGHAVTLFGADGSRVPGVEIVRLGIDAAAMTPAAFSGQVAASATPADIERVGFLRIAYEIRRRAGDFDVVHNHAFDAPAFELLREAHPRVVHTLHLPPVVSAVVNAAAGAARSAIMVSVSDFMARAWAPILGATRVIRNGVPLDRMPSRGPFKPGWLFVGRISPEKGLEDAMTVAEQAGRRLRVVGGVYDRAYHDRLASRLARHDVIGPMPRARVFLELASAEGVLMPAGWDEPFGLVAVEAMATGTPVAAYARGALPEVIADGISGYLVPPGDLDALARAAASFSMLDRGQCREWAHQNFDLSRMIDGHVRLYQELA